MDYTKTTAKAEYAKKLKKPAWQIKRLQILKRDEYKCLLCRDGEETLHVHHKTYIGGRDPWDYDDGNFMTLCESCHGLIEHCKKSEYDIRKCVKYIFKPFTVLITNPSHEKEIMICAMMLNGKLDHFTLLPKDAILKVIDA